MFYVSECAQAHDTPARLSSCKHTDAGAIARRLSAYTCASGMTHQTHKESLTDGAFCQCNAMPSVSAFFRLQYIRATVPMCKPSECVPSMTTDTRTLRVFSSHVQRLTVPDTLQTHTHAGHAVRLRRCSKISKISKISKKSKICKNGHNASATPCRLFYVQRLTC